MKILPTIMSSAMVNNDYCTKCRRHIWLLNYFDLTRKRCKTPPLKPRRSFLPLSLSESDISLRLKHLNDEEEYRSDLEDGVFASTISNSESSYGHKFVKILNYFMIYILI